MSAAWYALTDEELQEILEHTESEVDLYVKGIVTAGIRLYKYEASEEVCSVSYFISDFI